MKRQSRKNFIWYLLWIMVFFCTVSCGKAPDQADTTAVITEEETEGPKETMVETVEETVPLETKPIVDESKKKTLMIYMVGSDLESSCAAATNDMQEMIKSQVDCDRVRVILYTGGSTKWHSDVPNDANAIFLLTEDGFRLIDAYEDRSMGEAENLSFFLNYTYKTYPSAEYSLILWDHGNGPVMGYGTDRLHENDALTLPEMKEALLSSPFGPDNRLSFIGFDACLMASAELALVVKDHAHYLIASQETEANFGWNYSFLSKMADATSEELPRIIVDSYMEYCTEYGQKHVFFESEATLAVVELTRIAALEQAVNDLFRAAMRDVSRDFRSLIRARIAGRDMGKASTGSDYDLVDLWTLADAMKTSYPQQAENVMQVLSDCIIYNRSNTVGCTGLSLFYPFYNKNYYDYRWRDDYKKLGLFSDYQAYLNRYTQVWLGTSSDNFFAGALKPEQSGEHEYNLTLQKEQLEHFAKAGYYILQRTGNDLYRMIYYSEQVTEDEGVLTATFDGKVLTIQDRFGRSEILPAVVTGSLDQVTYYTTDLMFRNEADLFEATDLADAECAFLVDHETGEVRVLSIMRKGISQEIREPETEKTVMETEITFEEEPPESETGEAELETASEAEKPETEKPETEEPEAEETEPAPEEIAGGKRDLVDPQDWNLLMVPKNGEYHLKRNEKDNVCAFGEWEKANAPTYVDLPTKDGIDFMYAPLYEEEGYEYYLLFDLMDIQGNHVGSELLPIAVASAPADKSQQMEPIRIELSKETEQTILWEEDGLRMTWFYHVDEETQVATVDLRFENEMEYGVGVKLEDIFLNDTAQALTGVRVNVESGEDVSAWMKVLSDLREKEQNEPLRSIEFTLTLVRRENAQTLWYNKRFVLTFPEDGETAEKPNEPQQPEENEELRPFMEAYATKQVLTSGKQYAITLLSMAANDNEELCFELLFENRSKKYRSFLVSGMNVNGCFVEFDEQIVSLHPGKHTYLTLTVSRQRMEDAGVAGIHNLALLVQTNSLKKKMVEGEAWHSSDLSWLTIGLAKCSDMEQTVTYGTLLQQIGAVSIMLLGSEKTMYASNSGAGKYSWKLLVMNESDFHIQMDLVDVRLDGQPPEAGLYKNPVLSSGKIGAHTLRYLDLYYIFDNINPECDIIDFTMAIRSFNGDDTIVASNMRYTLSAEKTSETPSEEEPKKEEENEKEQ